ncbi:hypothetical protein VP01_160g4 [Puccinia sorghi]|uniref:Uncharacterized protein n=1 Tax=Puccinia sorghi TaxID=27349 RepID=A0A0L6VH35_9BASI|nr:hypothetical protein VP01_160g4 [Puccinia sorghi]
MGKKGIKFVKPSILYIYLIFSNYLNLIVTDILELIRGNKTIKMHISYFKVQRINIEIPALAMAEQDGSWPKKKSQYLPEASILIELKHMNWNHFILDLLMSINGSTRILPVNWLNSKNIVHVTTRIYIPEKSPDLEILFLYLFSCFFYLFFLFSCFFFWLSFCVFFLQSLFFWLICNNHNLYFFPKEKKIHYKKKNHFIGQIFSNLFKSLTCVVDVGSIVRDLTQTLLTRSKAIQNPELEDGGCLSQGEALMPPKNVFIFNHRHAPTKLSSKLHLFACVDVGTVTVKYAQLVESILEKVCSNNRSLLGVSECQLQAVEQVFFFSVENCNNVIGTVDINNLMLQPILKAPTYPDFNQPKKYTHSQGALESGTTKTVLAMQETLIALVSEVTFIFFLFKRTFWMDILGLFIDFLFQVLESGQDVFFFLLLYIKDQTLGPINDQQMTSDIRLLNSINSEACFDLRIKKSCREIDWLKNCLVQHHISFVPMKGLSWVQGLPEDFQLEICIFFPIKPKGGFGFWITKTSLLMLFAHCNPERDFECSSFWPPAAQPPDPPAPKTKPPSYSPSALSPLPTEVCLFLVRLSFPHTTFHQRQLLLRPADTALPIKTPHRQEIVREFHRSTAALPSCVRPAIFCYGIILTQTLAHITARFLKPNPHPPAITIQAELYYKPLIPQLSQIHHILNQPLKQLSVYSAQTQTGIKQSTFRRSKLLNRWRQ